MDNKNKSGKRCQQQQQQQATEITTTTKTSSNGCLYRNFADLSSWNRQSFSVVFEQNEALHSCCYGELTMSWTENRLLLDFRVRIQGNWVEFSKSHARQKQRLYTIPNCKCTFKI